MLGDCLERMKEIPDGSVDMVLTDPPYGITSNEYDKDISFLPQVFNECFRVLKKDGCLLSTASEPFNHELYFMLKKYWKHSWVWDKNFPGSFQNAKYRPLKVDESVMLFSKGSISYFPIMEDQKERKKGHRSKISSNYNGLGASTKEVNWNKKYPKSIIRFFNGHQKGKVHPNQKPLDLLEYMIQTYSKENDLILDPFMGSGSTGVACVNTNRNFIGIELNEKYFEIAKNRIEEAEKNKKGIFDLL